ncbi:MAG: ATP-binding protein, partial [Myxococcota bacterium]
LRQLASALEAQQHDLQDFAYVATHDLQAPARAVVGFADLVGRELNGHGTPKQKEWLGNIRRAGFEMQNLIDGLHTLSRVYSGGAPATELSCDTILDAALESRAERIDDRAVIVSRSPLPSIKVDGQQFQQLLSHLIDNAITFNESDVPRVYVDATQTDSEWVFSIRDNGIGIPEQFHDEVFTVFRRLNPKSEFDGNGLGLAMCKRIVQRHGGRIWLDSSPAAGTTVYFSIPANRTREDVASPADDDVSGSEM